MRNGRIDLRLPLQVRISFSSIPRRTLTYNGGDPVDLIDYRTIPVILQDGNDTASVNDLSVVTLF